MLRIRVDPAQLYALSARFRQAAGELRAVDGRVSGALNRLTWEARQKANVDGQANHARRQAQALAEQAEAMARYLEQKAQTFEEADQQSVRQLDQTAGQFTEVHRQATREPYLSTRTYPRSEVDAYLRLGGGSSGGAGPVPVHQRPDGRRAMFDIALDAVLERLEPLNLVKDAWDVAHVGEWQRQWDQAAQYHQDMVLRYGRNSTQAEEAYRAYFETAVFDMPFFGSKIEGLIWLLNKTAKPVY